jgi:hypothetical protein
MHHIGIFKTLNDAMEQALATLEPILYKDLIFKEQR